MLVLSNSDVSPFRRRSLREKRTRKTQRTDTLTTENGKAEEVSKCKNLLLSKDEMLYRS